VNKRGVGINLFFLCLFSLHSSGLMAKESSANEMVALVKQTVEKERLVDKPECTDYHFMGNVAPYIDQVNVVEKHGGVCGGDPEVSPRLFSVYVDVTSHKMATDKDDPIDGKLTPLPQP